MSCRIRKCLVVFVFLLALGVGPVAEADQGVVPRGAATLESGMAMDEVLRSWGAPAEREEREAKREDVWHYANASVEFSNGRVVRWKKAENASLTATAAQPQTQRLPALSPRHERPIADKAVSEILDELQGDESPDGADAEMPALLGKIGAALNSGTHIPPPAAGRPTPINILPPEPEIDPGEE
jgi:hypothetical protein